MTRPSSFPILGLHHVTATVDQAQPDLDFTVGALGLRLVKKTVNFDNHHVYHFYYGDERGTPGTIWTTFPYHGHGVPPGTKGASQVITTSFSVPVGSLEYWRTRLTAQGLASNDLPARFGEVAVAVSDPSGLSFELVAAQDDRRPWLGEGIDESAAIRGLHSVTLLVLSPTKTVALMTGLLGFSVVDETEDCIRLGVNGGGPGKTVDVRHAPDARLAMNGIGTVHHVAFAIGEASEQLDLRAALLDKGCRVTEVRDRQYFQSIYFREPGGVLFEVATVAPGFTVDEDLSQLGSALKLPPWEEPARRDIERGLPSVHPRGVPAK